MSLKINKEKTEDHWLVLESEADDAWPHYEVICKWDGCVHLTQISGEELENNQYWHFCDSLKDSITFLHKIRGIAQEHFKGGEYWE